MLISFKTRQSRWVFSIPAFLQCAALHVVVLHRGCFLRRAAYMHHQSSIHSLLQEAAAVVVLILILRQFTACCHLANLCHKVSVRVLAGDDWRQAEQLLAVLPLQQQQLVRREASSQAAPLPMQRRRLFWRPAIGHFESVAAATGAGWDDRPACMRQPSWLASMLPLRQRPYYSS